MLKVDMTVTHLKIVIDGMDKPLIDADFCEKIIPDDSNWSIEDGQSIILFLEKATEIIWKSAFKGGKEIDTNMEKMNESYEHGVEMAKRRMDDLKAFLEI